MASKQESTTLTIKKELFQSETPWIVFNEDGKTVARFAEREDAGAFLYPDPDEREEFEDKVACLKRLVAGDPVALHPDYGFNNDELLRLGIGYGVAGPLSVDQTQREALEVLNGLEAS